MFFQFFRTMASSFPFSMFAAMSPRAIVAFGKPIAFGVFKILSVFDLLKQTLSLSTFCSVIPETMKYVRVSFSHYYPGRFFHRGEPRRVIQSRHMGSGFRVFYWRILHYRGLEMLIDLTSLGVVNRQSIKHFCDGGVYFRPVFISESQNFVNGGASVHAAFS
jgi:hypothetical protein